MSNKLKYVFVFGKSGKRHVCILDKIFRSGWLVQGLKLTWLHEIGFCIKKKKKRLFSSSSLSALRVLSSAYLRLLIFLPAFLILASASSSPAFHMIHSECKLNKQGDNIQPWCIPFLILNQSVVPCPVLTVASWPAKRFLRRQVKWSTIPVSWRIFQLVVIHTKTSA